MLLKCECGSEFFVMQEAKRYEEVAIATGKGYAESSIDGWRIYMCVNCHKVKVPEMSTLSGVKRDELAEHAALVSTAKGSPVSVVPTETTRKFLYR